MLQSVSMDADLRSQHGVWAEKNTEKQEHTPQNQSLNREKRIPAGDSAQRDDLWETHNK